MAKAGAQQDAKKAGRSLFAEKAIDFSRTSRHDGRMEFDTEAERRILSLFGKTSLRPGQRTLLQHALAGRNALGVLPTGHGKSLCYQAAAVLLGGTSVVVSPLIALMRDQVQQLQALGIAARRFDSTLDETARTALLRDIAAGKTQLLFVAPESIENAALSQALGAATLSLFVIDEAHCVSEWGHSFRPDYLKLPAWQQERGFHSVMALTATATPRVQQDLCQTFRIAPECVTALSPYRPNIRRLALGAENREETLLQFLQDPARTPAIIYARSRKETETLAARLTVAGFPAAAYHAGQPADVREQLQDSFLLNRTRILVATIAFGMGIDKPDVRTVIHYDAPSSPESYLQESGRAGRDGAPAASLVLLQGRDLLDAANRIYGAEPDEEGVLRCVRWLLPAMPRAVSLWELGTACDVADDVPLRALDRLQADKAIEITARGYRFYKVRPLFPMPTILDGRAPAETARLLWLDKHREGEIEEAAETWNCTYAEAMEQLRECEAAGEWKLTFRQQALCLRPLAPANARSVAEALSAAYARRREADLERLSRIIRILSDSSCINAALEEYFTGSPCPPCGHCSACLGQKPAIPPAPAAPPPPPAADLPEFTRDAQRKRFLLGIASPGILARRLWNHPLYATASGTSWQDL